MFLKVYLTNLLINKSNRDYSFTHTKKNRKDKEK